MYGREDPNVLRTNLSFFYMHLVSAVVGSLARYCFLRLIQSYEIFSVNLAQVENPITPNIRFGDCRMMAFGW